MQNIIIIRTFCEFLVLVVNWLAISSVPAACVARIMKAGLGQAEIMKCGPAFIFPISQRLDVGVI